MAGHQGLHKVVKTVRGKKGSTHRSYWVKNEAAPQKQGFFRKHGADIASAALGGAMLVGGVAMMVAGHRAAMNQTGAKALNHAHNTARFGAPPPRSEASHPGIVRGNPSQVVGSFHMPSSSGNRGESPHPHFGAGSPESPRPLMRSAITPAQHRELATELALNTTLARARNRSR